MILDSIWLHRVPLIISFPFPFLIGNTSLS